MAATDCLVDFKMVGAIDNMQKSKPDGWKISKADGQRNGYGPEEHGECATDIQMG